MTTATVGKRYQMVIPRKERERLGIRPLCKVKVEAREHCLVVYPVATRGMRGLGADVADGTDATDYVRRLRAEWGRRA